MSEAHRGNRSSVGRVLSDATKAKIAESLRGRKQTPEQVAYRNQRWREEYERRGGISEAHRAQLERTWKRGPEHPRWTGTTPARTLEFRTPQYIAFRTAVLKRDNYTCQWCGARQGLGHKIRLEVDHILSYGEHPDLRFDTDNGRTLCFDCHRRIRPKGERRPNSVDFVPKPRTCAHCGQQFRVRNPRKFCPDCRAALCCPVCGSSVCAHWQRKALPYYSEAH